MKTWNLWQLLEEGSVEALLLKRLRLQGGSPELTTPLGSKQNAVKLGSLMLFYKCKQSLFYSVLQRTKSKSLCCGGFGTVLRLDQHQT